MRLVRQRKRKLKLDPTLTERICLPGRPPRLKVSPGFRSRFLAYLASLDLKAFAGFVHNAALHGDKLFFKYLAEFQEKKPIRLPISEQQSKLLQLHYQNPRLSASEAMKRLGWKSSKANYRSEKKRALERARLMQQTYRDGWLH